MSAIDGDHPEAPSLPDQDLEREISRLDYEASIKQASDRLHFQQEIGLAAIKSMMIANGGAILALLTFLGNHQADFDAVALKWAFGCFTGGLLFTLASYIGGYFSQAWLSHYDTSIAWNYQDDMRRRPRQNDIKTEGTMGAWLLRFSVACLLMSLGAFGWGAFSALDGIL
jgi:hypothetical protein